MPKAKPHWKPHWKRATCVSAILMTSLAFILGVVPLYIASGASAASQKEIGTGVFWGMVIGANLRLPGACVLCDRVQSVWQKSKQDSNANPPAATSAAQGGSQHE